MRQKFSVIIAAAIVLLSTNSAASDTDKQQCLHFYTGGKVVQAYQSCLPLAQVGDPQAAFILARLFALGVDGKAPDWEKVVEWLTISAAGDNAEAAYNLAIAHQKGKGTVVDLQKSLIYYRQSVDLGNPKAMRNLALLYEKGEGVDKDITLAFTLYLRSAELGLSDSQLKAGLMLWQGEGVDKDPAASRRWIEKAAQAGNDKAQLALGVLLIDTDPGSALYWYRRAVSAGNPYAAHNLALVYFEGLTGRQDLFQALAYADASIELGNPKTQSLYDKILARIRETGFTPRGTHSPVFKSTTVSARASADSSGSPRDSKASESTSDPLFKDVRWLKEQPPGMFVVQLARLTTMESAIRFINEYRLEGMAHTVILDQHDYVVLLQDSFADKRTALQIFKAKLPATLAGEAWVRSYRSLYTR